MDPLEKEARDLTNEELHDYMRQIMTTYMGDLEEDEYDVLEEAAQRILDRG